MLKILSVVSGDAAATAEPLPQWPRWRPLGWLRIVRAALVTLIALLLLIIPHLAWLALRGRAPSPIASAFLRLVCWGIGLVPRSGGERFAAQALVVANHISWSDILVLGAVNRTVFVARADVRGWPGMGLLARLGGTIFVDRASRRSTPAQARAIAEALRRGRVVLFPEGTTGEGSALLPFRPALLEGAGSAPVQPVAIGYRPRRGAAWGPGEREAFAWDGDKPFLAHFLAVIAAGGAKADIAVLPPLTAPADRKQRAGEARALIEAALAAVA